MRSSLKGGLSVGYCELLFWDQESFLSLQYYILIYLRIIICICVLNLQTKYSW